MSNFFKIYTLTPWDSLNLNTLTEVKLYSLKNIFKTFPIIEPEFLDDILSNLYKFKHYSWIESIKRIVGPKAEDYDIKPWNLLWGMDNERRIYQLLMQKSEEKAILVALAPPELGKLFKQFKKASELLSEIPDYIKVFYVSGNHEPVRYAIPRPAVPKKYCEDLLNIGIKCLGNPSIIKTHNVNTLIYHGESMHDINRLIHDLDINKPIETMKEFLICRHLAPVFGEKTQLAPISSDFLVLNKIPDIFHTGHIHINGMGKYRNVTLVNSGCFQAQTDFMRSFGINPTPGIVPIIELDSLNYYQLDFKKID